MEQHLRQDLELKDAIRATEGARRDRVKVVEEVRVREARALVLADPKRKTSKVVPHHLVGVLLDNGLEEEVIPVEDTVLRLLNNLLGVLHGPVEPPDLSLKLFDDFQVLFFHFPDLIFEVVLVFYEKCLRL